MKIAVRFALLVRSLSSIRHIVKLTLERWRGNSFRIVVSWKSPVFAETYTFAWFIYGMKYLNEEDVDRELKGKDRSIPISLV